MRALGPNETPQVGHTAYYRTTDGPVLHTVTVIAIRGAEALVSIGSTRQWVDLAALLPLYRKAR